MLHHVIHVHALCTSTHKNLDAHKKLVEKIDKSSQKLQGVAKNHKISDAFKAYKKILTF